MIKNDTQLKGFDDLTFGQHGGFADGKARQARLTFGQRDKDNHRNLCYGADNTVKKTVGHNGQEQQFCDIDDSGELW